MNGSIGDVEGSIRASEEGRGEGGGRIMEGLETVEKPKL